MNKKIVQTTGKEQLGEFAPMFAHLNDDVLFGEVWNEEAPAMTEKEKYQNTIFFPVGNIPANIKHWHGAAPDSWFSHLAVEINGEETSNEWLEAVSDKNYGKLK